MLVLSVLWVLVDLLTKCVWCVNNMELVPQRILLELRGDEEQFLMFLPSTQFKNGGDSEGHVTNHSSWGLRRLDTSGEVQGRKSSSELESE